MTLPIPNLDDRTYDDLVAEALELIPQYFPEWTDYNPSDPGITLMELLAFFFETSLYSLNRIPDRSLEHFAGLVGVTRREVNGRPESIESLLRRALLLTRRITRAVTEPDFKVLIRREFCVNNRPYRIFPPLTRNYPRGTMVDLFSLAGPIGKLAQAAEADTRQLTIATESAIEVGDLLIVLSGLETDIVEVTGVIQQIATVEVELAQPLKHTYDIGTDIEKVGDLIEMSYSTLRYDGHSNDESVVLTLKHPPEAGVLTEPAVSGDTALSLLLKQRVYPGEQLLLAGGDHPEFVGVTEIEYLPDDQATLQIGDPLKHDHPADTVVYHARHLDVIGDINLLYTQPRAELPLNAVLLINPPLPDAGDQVQSDLCLAHGIPIARSQAVVTSMRDRHVYPADQLTNVIIVPDEPEVAEPVPPPSLCRDVFDFLQQQRLLTTWINVIKPLYTEIRIGVTVVLNQNSRLSAAVVKKDLIKAIQTFFNPLQGGRQGRGWPFGRSVYRSELYELIENQAGVDHTRELLLNRSPISDEIYVQPLNLVHLPPDHLTVNVVDASNYRSPYA